MAQANDIAIDLGTSNVVIYMKGRGIVFREPSVVAVDRDTQNIIAFGQEAHRMIGRTPANVNVIRPLAQGEMLDFDLTSAMLRFFVSNLIGKRLLSRPRAVMSVPTGVKDMEKKALISSMFDAGIRLVMDISAGCTDLAVLYNSNVSVISNVHIGGDHFDDAIIRYLRKKYNMLIGERTAEQIKITLGGAIRRDPPVVMDITGRNLLSGLPKTMSIESDEIYEALIDQVNDLIEALQAVIERTPPQLASDVFDTGVTLTGGGSLLYGLSEAIGSALNIPCQVSPEAKDCVVLGCARVLTDPIGMRHLLANG